MTTTPTIPSTIPSTGAPTGRSPRPRTSGARALGTVLALAIVLAGLSVAAAPAGAATPHTPTAIIARGYSTSIRFWYAPPADDGGEAISSYRVERYVVGVALLDKVWNRTDASVLVDTTALNGVDYRYRVRATNADGISPWTGFAYASRVAGFTDYHSVGGSKADFVKRQYADFLGRAPGFGELNQALLDLGNGSATPASVIATLAARPERVGSRHPVIRLYAAYFDRAPDHGGLAYWAAQRAAGTKDLDDVSSSFAGSNEFQTTYGALTNAQFVDLVYQNVLDRAPEPTGFAYWTGQLDGGQVTRGRLMTQFSESNEFTVTSQGRVWAADLNDAMLHTAISGSSMALWGRHLLGGGTVGGFGTRLLLLQPII